MKARAKIVCENRRPLKRRNEKDEVFYPIVLRVTHQRIRRYYDIGLEHLTLNEWDKIQSGKRLNSFLTEVKNSISAGESKAISIIDKMPRFNFVEFKREYFGSPTTTVNSFFGIFEKYIENLRTQGRIGTANSYHCALASLKSFKKSIHWNDICPAFLEEYEEYMIKLGRSQNTIGIYLRSLRAIVNQGISAGVFPQSNYPFGKESHGKYQIPSSVNTKKALTSEEIELIKNIKPVAGSRMKKAKDFWLFSYYINGLNMSDIAHLKWKNIDFEEGMIRFIRKKTERANKGHQVQISAVLTPFANEVIENYGIDDRAPDNFVFPVIEETDSPERRHAKIHNFTKSINIGLKQLCKELGITKKIKTYSARHSHATILIQRGASMEQVMDQFKHSSLKVTMNYIDSISDQSRKDLSKLL